MPELVKENVEKFLGVVWEDVVGYLRLYDFIKLKAKRLIDRPKNVNSVSSFWSSVLGDSFGHNIAGHFVPLRDGDVVSMRDIFISEWAPKLPGQIWTTSGVTAFAEGQKDSCGYYEFENGIYAVLSPGGKYRVVSAGYGTIRVNRDCGTKDNFMYMSLTDRENWSCDYGIPVIVSESVYRRYQEFALKGAPWVERLEGVLHINDGLPFDKFIPSALGANLSPETESALRHRPYLPKCYIHIVSPLSLQFRHNDSHPDATAWTMFETKIRQERFAYTYTAFNPCRKGSVEQAVDFLKWYVRHFSGKRFVTDFDGQMPRLEAEISLEADPLRRRKRKAAEFVKKCDTWTSSLLKGTAHD